MTILTLSTIFPVYVQHMFATLHSSIWTFYGIFDAIALLVYSPYSLVLFETSFVGLFIY